MTTHPEPRSEHPTPATASVSSWRAVLRGLGDGSLGSALSVGLATGAAEDAADAPPRIGARRATDAEADTRLTVEPREAIGTPAS